VATNAGDWEKGYYLFKSWGFPLKELKTGKK
jgi:hypothetical protein